MIPFPLILGAATLLFMGKKKRSKTSGSSGSASKPARLLKDGVISGWNDVQAREVMGRHWKDMGKVLNGGGTFFVLMRDTAMELWPSVKWPLTIDDEMRMVNVAPGSQVPAWVYNLGSQGDAAVSIWIKLRTLAWDITDYKPPS